MSSSQLGKATEQELDRERQRASLAVPKRIIVCCDGTWQDGVIQQYRWQYSNVLKFSRVLDQQDNRHTPPISQVIFYQAGIGTSQNIYSEVVEGATGISLIGKVQEVYAFIAHNYQPGDEIFLFGFSRGAYTVRMVAALIGEIGVLDKKDMDFFADIFIAYQKRGKTTDQKEIDEQNKTLEPWVIPEAKGRIRADPDGDTFTIKCIGVFDTVGALGLPEELTIFDHNKKFAELFGFQHKNLGAHIQYAFHAMALNETRASFDVAKFEQTPEGKAKGQILKQVWFPGSHSDIGGGWLAHDLSDISLAWMAANVDAMLSLDEDYLCRLPRPVAPWGQLLPHDPATGIFKLARIIQREVAEKVDITHEMIHPSVLAQLVQLPEILEKVKKNPSLLSSLHRLEDRFKKIWPYTPAEEDDKLTNEMNNVVKSEVASQESMKKNIEKLMQEAAARQKKAEVVTEERGLLRYLPGSLLGSVVHRLVG